LIAGLLGVVIVTLFMRFAAAIDNSGVLGAGLIILVSIAIAWKRPLTGGAVLIVEGLLSIAAIVVAWVSNPAEALGLATGYYVFGPFVWVFLCLVTAVPCAPLLISGALFILSWREGRRTSANSTSP